MSAARKVSHLCPPPLVPSFPSGGLLAALSSVPQCTGDWTLPSYPAPFDAENCMLQAPYSTSQAACLSVCMQAMLERLGGVPEDWRRAYSEAASRRQWSLDVRYRMARSHAGRKCRCACISFVARCMTFGLCC